MTEPPVSACLRDEPARPRRDRRERDQPAASRPARAARGAADDRHRYGLPQRPGLRAARRRVGAGAARPAPYRRRAPAARGAPLRPPAEPTPTSREGDRATTRRGLRDERDLAGFTLERDARRAPARGLAADDRRRRRARGSRSGASRRASSTARRTSPRTTSRASSPARRTSPTPGCAATASSTSATRPGPTSASCATGSRSYGQTPSRTTSRRMYEARFLLHDPWIVFLRMLVTHVRLPGRRGRRATSPCCA